MYISKSDYQIGRRCLKRLWQEKHESWSAELSSTDKKNAFEGNRFNDAVHEVYSNGIMIGWGNGSAEQAAAKTADYLQQDSVILFEAFFIHNGLLCLADVVVKESGKITLIEAKSSNNPKIKKKDDFEHIHDAAFQAYVMSKCGFTPDEVQLLHANVECVWPDKVNLFSFLDITEDALARFDEVEIASSRMLEELSHSNAPGLAIGKFCKKPADKACPHIHTCWTLPTERTIYDLVRITDDKLEALEAEGVHLIEDVPAGAELTQGQWDVVNLIQNQAELADTDQVKALLNQLEYPIHFFDYETYNPAVPMWNGARPWQQIPFQYSLHILHESGELEHYEYLHTDIDDPRPKLISAMKRHFKDTGSVVVYFATFEKGRNSELARDFPEHRTFLEDINDRTWDQLDVFKKCFDDHRLALSKSIKVVLPTFVPELSYQALNVQKGDQAQLEWRKMIDIKHKPTQQAKADDLRAYCELDTLAMVKLHEYLVGLFFDVSY